MLKFLSTSGDIKICASTRPRSVFEEFFRNPTRTFDISSFTKEDMKRHVRQRLQESKNFQNLELADPNCGDIVNCIAELAQGVWLWVFLITRDLTRAANRHESVAKLWEIVQKFSPDLKMYFERMISSIRPQYVEEMSQNFLIILEERQPLPLYAFSVLEEERKDPDYAVKAPIQPISDAELCDKYPIWTSRIRNRCSDLLVVYKEPHPSFFSHSVDFLHRSVRDYLQENYYTQLKQNLRHSFSSTASLCKIRLVFLKSLPILNLQDSTYIEEVIGLTIEMMHYAYETEKTSGSPDTSLVEVLDELDRVNRYHADYVRNHWLRVSPASRYPYGGGFYFTKDWSFLALAVQSGLVKYVRVKLRVDANNVRKHGRPLLDFAFLMQRNELILMARYQRFEIPRNIDVDMVQLLLEHGADPNQPIHDLNDSRTVWQMFLISLHNTASRPCPGYGGKLPWDSVSTVWYQACKLLIQYGAQEYCLPFPDYPEITVWYICDNAFASARTATLQELMNDKGKERQKSNASCDVM